MTTTAELISYELKRMDNKWLQLRISKTEGRQAYQSDATDLWQVNLFDNQIASGYTAFNSNLNSAIAEVFDIARDDAKKQKQNSCRHETLKYNGHKTHTDAATTTQYVCTNCHLFLHLVLENGNTTIQTDEK